MVVGETMSIFNSKVQTFVKTAVYVAAFTSIPLLSDAQNSKGAQTNQKTTQTGKTSKCDITGAFAGADVALSFNDEKRAIADYGIVIDCPTASAKDKSTAYCNRGVCKYNLQDYKGALDDFNKAVKLGLAEKDMPTRFYQMRGYCKDQTGDEKGADVDNELSAKKFPANNKALAVNYASRGVDRYNQAAKKYTAGDYAGAAELFTAAVNAFTMGSKYDSKNADIKANMANAQKYLKICQDASK